MTPYALLLDRCGLSHREAARLHNVRPDTVKSWASGRRSNDGALAELRALYAQIARAADHAVAVILEAPPEAEIEIGYPADDHEAQALGLPCVGAWEAMAGMVVARLDRPIRFVPRGSTVASAAATDAHGV